MVEIVGETISEQSEDAVGIFTMDCNDFLISSVTQARRFGATRIASKPTVFLGK
jgi:hypothetical protein